MRVSFFDLRCWWQEHAKTITLVYLVMSFVILIGYSSIQTYVTKSAGWVHCKLVVVTFIDHKVLVFYSQSNDGEGLLELNNVYRNAVSQRMTAQRYSCEAYYPTAFDVHLQLLLKTLRFGKNSPTPRIEHIDQLQDAEGKAFDLGQGNQRPFVIRLFMQKNADLMKQSFIGEVIPWGKSICISFDLLSAIRDLQEQIRRMDPTTLQSGLDCLKFIFVMPREEAKRYFESYTLFDPSNKSVAESTQLQAIDNTQRMNDLLFVRTRIAVRRALEEVLSLLWSLFEVFCGSYLLMSQIVVPLIQRVSAGWKPRDDPQ